MRKPTNPKPNYAHQKPQKQKKAPDRMLQIIGGLFALMICLTLVIAVIYIAQK